MLQKQSHLQIVLITSSCHPLLLHYSTPTSPLKLAATIYRCKAQLIVISLTCNIVFLTFHWSSFSSSELAGKREVLRVSSFLKLCSPCSFCLIIRQQPPSSSDQPHPLPSLSNVLFQIKSNCATLLHTLSSNPKILRHFTFASFELDQSSICSSQSLLFAFQPLLSSDPTKQLPKQSANDFGPVSR